MENASRTTIQFPRSVNLNGLSQQLAGLIQQELGVRVNVPLYTACQLALEEAIERRGDKTTRDEPTTDDLDAMRGTPASEWLVSSADPAPIREVKMHGLLADIRGVMVEDANNQIPRQRWKWRFQEIEERLATILEPNHVEKEATP